jgi:hypothetical protein
MIEWKDVSSYSRGESGKKEPNAWACMVGGLKIVVVSAHIYNPDRWSLKCNPWFDLKDLDLPSFVKAEEAQKEALRLVRTKLQKSLDHINETLSK